MLPNLLWIPAFDIVDQVCSKKLRCKCLRLENAEKLSPPQTSRELGWGELSSSFPSTLRWEKAPFFRIFFPFLNLPISRGLSELNCTEFYYRFLFSDVALGQREWLMETLNKYNKFYFVCSHSRSSPGSREGGGAGGRGGGLKMNIQSWADGFLQTLLFLPA